MERCVICGREPGPLCPECKEAERDKQPEPKVGSFGNWNTLAPEGSMGFSSSDDNSDWRGFAGMSFSNEEIGWPYGD